MILRSATDLSDEAKRDSGAEAGFVGRVHISQRTVAEERQISQQGRIPAGQQPHAALPYDLARVMRHDRPADASGDNLYKQQHVLAAFKPITITYA